MTFISEVGRPSYLAQLAGTVLIAVAHGCLALSAWMSDYDRLSFKIVVEFGIETMSDGQSLSLNILRFLPDTI